MSRQLSLGNGVQGFPVRLGQVVLVFGLATRAALQYPLSLVVFDVDFAEPQGLRDRDTAHDKPGGGPIVAI